jgi:hypothetical protein
MGSDNDPNVPSQTVGVGFVSYAGTFYPNSSVSFRDMTDGSSNVMVVGEQSGWGKSGTANYDFRAGWPYSAWIGTEGFYNGATAIPASNGVLANVTGDSRCFNMTSIHFPIGTTVAVGGPSSQGSGCNTPIQSIHAGGAQILLGDGTVRFISSFVDFNLTKNLALIADGNPIGDY